MLSVVVCCLLVAFERFRIALFVVCCLCVCWLFDRRCCLVFAVV